MLKQQPLKTWFWILCHAKFDEEILNGYLAFVKQIPKIYSIALPFICISIIFLISNEITCLLKLNIKHWSNSGLLAKKSITHKISPDIIHLDLNKDPYVFN